MSMMLSKKGVIPYLIRELLSLIKAGDARSGSGMTLSTMNCLIERPCVDSHTYWLSNTAILYRIHVNLDNSCIDFGSCDPIDDEYFFLKSS